MARAKPPFRGQFLQDKMPHEYSEKLKKNLREFYPAKNAREDLIWGHPAVEFVSKILVAADYSNSMLYNMQADITNEEVKLEISDLLKTLGAADLKLRTISPDLDKLMSVNADPLGCADQIKQMICCLDVTKLLVDEMPRAKRPEQKKHPIVIEMTVLVLSVLKENGIEATAWVNHADPSKTSEAIKILQMVGDEIGLEYNPQTWRRLIQEAIAQDPSLREVDV